MPRYIPVIGLEIHLQLKTKRKMFCGCSAQVWQAQPNSRVCPTCLGLPGALPVPNQKAIQFTQRMGLSLHCQLAQESRFDRKNYFYPDLPKGYQISQYQHPLAHDGYLDLPAPIRKKIRIRRVHLEEDTAKSLHKKEATLLDFNKSGLPLMEIVTEPDLQATEEAVELGREIQRMSRWLKVSEADMEKGQLRLEPNISLAESDTSGLPNYKVEIKNINSFRFLKQAIQYEIKRQTDLLQNGETPRQESRGFNESKGVTVSQRTKEGEADYRYFPEPDIPPLLFDDGYLERVRQTQPILPTEAMTALIKDWRLSEKQAQQLTKNKARYEFFLALTQEGLEAKQAANLIIQKPEVVEKRPSQIVRAFRQKKVNFIRQEEQLKKVIQEVLEEQPEASKDYQAGKENALQFLIGQVMQKTKGQADPPLTGDLLRKALKRA